MGQHDRALIADGVFAFLRRRRSLEALAQTESPARLALAVVVRELGHSVRELAPLVSEADAKLDRRIQVATRDTARARGRRGSAGLAVGASRRRVRRRRAPRPRARMARAGTARPARQSAEGHARRRYVRRLRHPASMPWRRRTRRWDCGSRGGPRSRGIRSSRAARSKSRTKAASLIGYLVAPRRGEMVVDFCAGAGGKTLLLGRADALAGTALRVRRGGEAAREPEAAARALGALQRPSAADRERARREDQAARRQDRPRAGRCAVHRLRDVAAQSRPQVAAAGIRDRGARPQAGCDPRGGGDAGEAGRSPRLRDVQRAAR